MNPIEFNEIPEQIMNITGCDIKIKFPRQGHASNVCIITNSYDTYVLKRSKGEQQRSWLRNENFVLKCLSIEKIPVPKVLLFIEEEDTCQSWLLMNYIKGDTIRKALLNEEDDKKRHNIIFNFGKVLSQIHLSPCPKEFIKCGTKWIDVMLEKAEFNLRNYSTDGSMELLEKLKCNKPKDIQNTLIHGDYTIDNVLVHNCVITGIIDWSLGGYGDPRYDVSLAIRPKINAFQTKNEIDIFFEGYGDRIISKKEYDYFQDGGLYEFF